MCDFEQNRSYLKLENSGSLALSEQTISSLAMISDTKSSECLFNAFTVLRGLKFS